MFKLINNKWEILSRKMKLKKANEVRTITIIT